jgi:NAD(P)-dependent dehydrogenase (short-subunit alcohol dehydrogenase family)
MSKAKSVLVTGAGGGIGTALTRALSDRGFVVYAGVRGDAPELAGLPGVRIVRLDVTDERSVADAAAEVAAAQGDNGLQAVINNAGIIVQGPLELVPLDELRRQFEVNVYGPALVTRAFLPLLRTGGGRLISVSAPTGRVAMPYLGVLSASKAALESLSDAARVELAPWGIPVSIVQPGAMATGIFAKAETAGRKSLAGSDSEILGLYQPALDAIEKAMAGQSLSPVDTVVKVMIRALEARRPKPRYTAGRDARAVVVLSWLPTRLRDRLLESTMGIGGKVRSALAVTGGAR